MENAYIAVDLGAGSGRVFLGAFAEGKRPLIDEIRRFSYPPRSVDGVLRWDLSRILSEIKAGIADAARTASMSGMRVKSLGIDSWAVDYGLLDSAGTVLCDPACYRDERTRGAQERLFRSMPRSEIFERTGIQFLDFNTIFQLFSEKGIDRARSVLLLPDLINFLLTGKRVAEYTNATTTQLVNACSGDWDDELIRAIGLDRSLFPPIVRPGTDLGPLDAAVAAELGCDGVRVVAPATHDTASAVAGLPLGVDSAYISSGTWSLVGIELSEPLINADVARFNFTNEGGYGGTVRFLKNVMGLWIFERCRAEWEAAGIGESYDDLISKAAAIDGFPAFVFPDEPAFLNPRSMIDSIAAQIFETGQTMPAGPPAIAKIVLDSLAFRYATVIGTIERLTGRVINEIRIAGGGGKNDYLNQMTADACGKRVVAGQTEATVTGNLLVQAITDGRFEGIAEARDHVARNSDLRVYEPRPDARVEAARGRYLQIEERFLT